MIASVIICDLRRSNAGHGKHFVKISAIILEVGQYVRQIVPLSLWYLMTWCLNSMCLLLAEAILFYPSLIVTWLSS